jgi:thioredoxin-like negative regulator of GroEL
MDRLQQLEQLVADHPGDPLARYGLAMEYANVGQTDVALQHFAKLLEQHPDYIGGYQMSAQVLMHSGRNDEARQLLHEGISRAQRARKGKAATEMQAMLDELG